MKINDFERLLMECRYMLSLDKSYEDLAKKFCVSKETIYQDLNYKLLHKDKELYKRMQKKLNK